MVHFISAGPILLSKHSRLLPQGFPHKTNGYGTGLLVNLCFSIREGRTTSMTPCIQATEWSPKCLHFHHLSHLGVRFNTRLQMSKCAVCKQIPWLSSHYNQSTFNQYCWQYLESKETISQSCSRNKMDGCISFLPDLWKPNSSFIRHMQWRFSDKANLRVVKLFVKKIFPTCVQMSKLRITLKQLI